MFPVIEFLVNIENGPYGPGDIGKAIWGISTEISSFDWKSIPVEHEDGTENPEGNSTQNTPLLIEFVGLTLNVRVAIDSELLVDNDIGFPVHVFMLQVNKPGRVEFIASVLWT